MAISRILSTGFEVDPMPSGDNRQYGYEVAYFSHTTSGLYMSSTAPRTGGFSMYHQNTMHAVLNWPTAYTQVQISFAIRRINNWNRTAGDSPALFVLGDSMNENAASLVMNTSEQLEARTNNVAREAWVGTTMVGDKWIHIGADIKFHTTTGWFYVYVNGVEVIGYDGQTDHLLSAVNQVRLGGISTEYFSNGGYYDDLYINNSEGEGTPALPTDKRFHYIRANGNGNYAQWTGVDGNSVDNYLHVDDPGVPDLATTNVTDSTASNKDSYTLEDTDLSADATIDAVIPTVIARNAGGGVGTIKLLTRYSGADSLSAALPLETSYFMVQDRQTTKPGGGAWTPAIVDATEVGVEMQ